MAEAWMKKLHSDDLARLVLRIGVGGMMLLHGIGKIQGGVGAIESMLEAHHLPRALAWGSYVGEVVAPVLVILGILTRPAALIVCIQMAMAVYLAHAGDVGSLNEHGGWAIEVPALYFMGALALVFTGAGKFSVSRGKGGWD